MQKCVKIYTEIIIVIREPLGKLESCVLEIINDIFLDGRKKVCHHLYAGKMIFIL